MTSLDAYYFTTSGFVADELRVEAPGTMQQIEATAQG